jgi:hypothetical protein
VAPTWFDGVQEGCHTAATRTSLPDLPSQIPFLGVDKEAAIPAGLPAVTGEEEAAIPAGLPAVAGEEAASTHEETAAPTYEEAAIPAGPPAVTGVEEAASTHEDSAISAGPPAVTGEEAAIPAGLPDPIHDEEASIPPDIVPSTTSPTHEEEVSSMTAGQVSLPTPTHDAVDEATQPAGLDPLQFLGPAAEKEMAFQPEALQLNTLWVEEAEHAPRPARLCTSPIVTHERDEHSSSLPGLRTRSVSTHDSYELQFPPGFCADTNYCGYAPAHPRAVLSC